MPFPEQPRHPFNEEEIRTALNHSLGLFDIEQFSGHNAIKGPPPLARFHQTSRDPKLMWRRINDLDLLLPTKRPDGSIIMGEPVRISKQCIGLSAHSGIPSTKGCKNPRPGFSKA